MKIDFPIVSLVPRPFEPQTHTITQRLIASKFDKLPLPEDLDQMPISESIMTLKMKKMREKMDRILRNSVYGMFATDHRVETIQMVTASSGAFRFRVRVVCTGGQLPGSSATEIFLDTTAFNWARGNCGAFTIIDDTIAFAIEEDAMLFYLRFK